MEENNKTKLAKWLDTLQQESWQLELLISGFAIFLIIGIYEPLQDLRYEIEDLLAFSRRYGILVFYHAIATLAWFVLLLNLVIHVLVRGLWISTLGLRYLSGDIDFDKLRFQKPFDRFLRKRIGSFDRYIERLENICSVIFSFTFLVVFMLISFGMLVAFFFSFDLLQQAIIPKSWTDVTDNLGPIFIILFLFAALIYFIDFITLGWIKKIKWLSKIYYPIYRLFSWLTLANIYRPIYYNLIDNTFGRRLGYFLVPYFFLLVFCSTIYIETHAYFANNNSAFALNTNLYEDQRDEKSTEIEASIPSKFVSNGYLELFMPYNPFTDDKALQLLCPDLNPLKEAGWHSTIRFSNNSKREFKRGTSKEAMDCLSRFHEVYIDDSLYQVPKWYFYDHPKRRDKGLLTIIDVSHLERGPHALGTKTHFAKTANGKDTLVLGNSVYIPFWIE